MQLDVANALIADQDPAAQANIEIDCGASCDGT